MEEGTKKRMNREKPMLLLVQKYYFLAQDVML